MTSPARQHLSVFSASCHPGRQASLLAAATAAIAGLAACGSPAQSPPAHAATHAVTPLTAPARASTTPAPAGATASAAGSSPRPAAGLSACATSQLQASLGGGQGAGMSQERTGVQLRNAGDSACTLDGYPGVSWVAGPDGHQVGPAAARSGNGAGHARVVTLAPGALASAPLNIVEGDGGLPRSLCHPVPVRGLRVYPPGQRAALFIPAPSRGAGECSVPTRAAMLGVGFLRAGAQPGGGGAG